MRLSIKRKITEVNELVQLINNTKIIALINLEGLPSKQLQRLRKELGSKIDLKVITKNVMIRALDKSSIKGLKSLKEYINGVCGLAFTEVNPFKLSLLLKERTTPAPAKTGQVAPHDIIVNKGPTPFIPGPIISELAELGIKTKVEAGKLAVTEDATIVKEGEKVSGKAASIMSRLGMTPMKTGLNLVAAFEAGRVYSQKELLIDVDEYRAKISSAYLEAYNLAFNAELPIKEVIDSLIITAYHQARNLSLNNGLINKDNAGELLMLMQARAHALANKIKWR